MSNHKDNLVDTSKLIIQKGSKSFAAAARLFDLETRENAYMLYAWCRYCDDQIDNQELGFNGSAQSSEKTTAILEQLREQTQAAIDNKPCEEPVFEGLRFVLNHKKIPGRYAMELLEGFAMDAAETEYRTLDDTLLYCYYVAGVVGIMMAYIMGTEDEAALQRAIDLGIAFQLTNIARDVRDDAELGRTYLPGDWLEEAGIPKDDIMNPEHAQALSKVVERLLIEADKYYQSAEEGMRSLGFRAAWAVATARTVYREIGETVRERGEQAWQERVVVSKSRKFVGLANGMLSAARSSLIDRHLNVVPRDERLWQADEHLARQ